MPIDSTTMVAALKLIQPLRAWAEASYSTRLSRIEGPTFVGLTRQFLGAFEAGSRLPTVRALAREHSSSNGAYV